MANKQMFSLIIIDTDKFLEMPLSSRYLCEEKAAIWTDWIQNHLAAKYPYARNWRIEIEDERARLMDDEGQTRGEWDAESQDFLGELVAAIDPSLRRREGLFGWLKRLIR